ncbi:MAG: hypothetical protein NZ750_01775 [Anaerolineae bacterium]|nr:hypothetical protein [Anaerolineae bacterium]MDW8173312.1 hypothetical protein [Anaerolineae bacterium]
MSESTIIWVHGDNLNPHSAPFQTAPDAPAIFVWDDALLEEWRISLKRIVFIYECLLELPIIIRRGDVAEEVVQFAREHEARRILTSESPSPRHQFLCQTIIKHMPKGSRLEVLREPAFVDGAEKVDLKRFSRYWNAVKKQAMR